MKKLCTLLLVAGAISASGQDFCKHIIKEMSDDKTQVDYVSPSATQYLTPILVKRTVNTNPEWAVDNFTAVFLMTTDIESIYSKGADGSQKEKEEKKLTVWFDDNTKLVDDTVLITHDFTDDRTMAVRNLYYLSLIHI